MTHFTRGRSTAVAVLATMLVAGCATQARIPAAPPTPSSATAPSDIARPDVDSVPGLGRTTEAMLRDDTIAYWEAWKRGSATAACMDEAGFTWEPEVAYPDETVAEIAEQLKVPRSGEAAGTSAEELNADTYAGLEGTDRDRYARALVGESAEDLDEFSKTGVVPEGRDDSFATGGCVGAARQQVGRIWDLKDKVGPEILEAEKEIKQTRFDQVRSDYASCAAAAGLESVDEPADLDLLLDEATSESSKTAPADLDALVELTGRVAAECRPIWAAGSNEAYAHALSIVRDRHPDLFDAQIERYGNALAEVAVDNDFLSFLAHGH